MRSTTYFAITAIAIASLQEAQARLMGTRWTNKAMSHASSSPEDYPASTFEEDKIDSAATSASKPLITGTVLATLFDFVNEDNNDDACYNCCCDRDVVCNTHGKSEAICTENGCHDGATCDSKGYACPSFDCDAASDLW
jgi:hypothetical protein